jgi:endonuclease/exonuclease/phosphatase family metal-dependent hydrolase
LDRVMVEAPGSTSTLNVHSTRSARTASDHLPVVATVTWPAALVQPLATLEGDAAGAG